MCGIAGFIDFTGATAENILMGMTNTLQHRGPDGSGHRLFRNAEHSIGLGHRRLSIIDLSEAGSQPMQLDDLHIVFNGEIYNYREIGAELSAKGHQFTGHSDTEVLLHAYQEWGEACVSRFTGMFAFAIYNSRKNELFCARDRAGVKPFFYYFRDSLFLFASELKAFHRHPGFKKEIDHDAVAAFMQYGHVPMPHCIFKDARKLSAAHTLTLSLPQKELRLKKYWDVYDAYNQPKLNIPFKEAKAETESILRSAFEYRMVSDVPVGVFLSGGYDSACLTALLQKDRTEKLKTFTIGVEDTSLDEAPYAKEIARHLGTDHHEFYCTEKEMLELVPGLPYYYDEPFGDQSALPTTLVCKMARKQVTVALSADAGDEIFAGYNRYDYLLRYGRLLNKLPGIMRHSAAALMNLVPADNLPVLNKKYNFHNRYEKLKQLLKDPSPANMMRSLSTQFNNRQLQELLNHDYKELGTAYGSNALKEASYSPLAYMMAVDYQTYLPDDILQKVDRASMSASLEAREPFLDQRIIEWAARLPDAYKYFKGAKKYILKEIVHQYIPQTMMDRPKMGFAIPLEHWMMSGLKDQVIFYLQEKRLYEQGIFDASAVTKLKTDFFNGKKELAQKLWYILMFQMWYEKWMCSSLD